MKKFLLILCLILSASQVVFSQNWREYSDSIIYHFNNSEFEEALKYIQLAEIELSKKTIFKDTLYANYLYAKGVYYSVDSSIYGIDLLEQSLNIWNKSKNKNQVRIMKIYFFLGKCYLNLAINSKNKSDYTKSYSNFNNCRSICNKYKLKSYNHYSSALFKQIQIANKIKGQTNLKILAREYIDNFTEEETESFSFDIITIYRLINDFEGQESLLKKYLYEYERKKLKNSQLLYNIYFELVNNNLSQKDNYGEFKNIKNLIEYGEKAYDIFKSNNFDVENKLGLILKSLELSYSLIGDNINSDKYENLQEKYFPSNQKLTEIDKLKKLIKLKEFNLFKNKFDEYESYLLSLNSFNNLAEIYSLALNLYEKNILFKKDEIKEKLLYVEKNKSKLSNSEQIWFSHTLIEFYADEPENYLAGLDLCNKYLDVTDISLRLSFYNFKSLFEEELGNQNARNTRYKTLDLAKEVYGENSPQLLEFYSAILEGDILSNDDSAANAIISSTIKILYDFKLDSTEIGAKCWYYIGSNAVSNSNYSSALIYLERSKAIFELLESSHSSYSNLKTLQNSCVLDLVRLYLKIEDYETVNIYLNDVKSYLDSVFNDDKTIKSGYYICLGDLNFYQKNFNDAKKYYSQSLLIGNNKVQVQFKIIICDFMINSNVEKAIDALQEFNKINNTQLGNQYIYLLKYGIGEVKSAQSFLLENLEDIIKRNSTFFHLLSDDERYKIYKSEINQFEFLNTYLLIDKNPDFIKIFLKYRFYLNSLLLNNSFKLTTKNERNVELFNELKSNSIQINKALENNKLDSISIANLNNRNIEIQRILSIEKKPTQTITDNIINARLNNDEAFVQIIRINKQKKNLEIAPYFKNIFTDTISYGAIFIKKNVAPYFILIDSSGILENSTAQLYRENIQNKKMDSVSYHFLFEKIDENIKGIKKIFLVDDGIYNSINLESIFNPNKNKFIIDYLRIQQVQDIKKVFEDTTHWNSSLISKADLFGNPNFDMDLNSSINNEFLQLGSLSEVEIRAINNGNKITPLINTADELKEIKKILLKSQFKVGTYTIDSANEDNLKKVKSPSLLHIATHGFFITQNEKSKTKNKISELYNDDYKNDPYLKSGLLMAGAQTYISGKNIGNNNNGIFTSSEAKSLDLNGTELVVLSACETGLGIGLKGEGVIGLSRAFMIAGAKSVIMSLWPVSDDKTKQLMVKFYTNLILNKMNKKDALYFAKKEIKKLYPEPYYWAGFLLIE